MFSNPEFQFGTMGNQFYCSMVRFVAGTVKYIVILIGSSHICTRRGNRVSIRYMQHVLLATDMHAFRP
jgi:hypothetical protein